MCRLYFSRLQDDTKALQILLTTKDSIPPQTYDCYSPYAIYYDGAYGENGDMYFGFYADKNIEKLAEEFNSKFNNIKVNIIGIEEDTIIKTETGFHDEKKITRYTKKNPEKFSWIIFKVELNEGYSIQANYILTLAIAQFFRVYCPEYVHYSRIINKEPTLENVLHAFNNYSGFNFYGVWSGTKKCDLGILMKFDDIELINRISEPVDMSDMPLVSHFLNAIETNSAYVNSEDWL